MIRKGAAVFALVAALSGCSENEAKRFGYTGADLEETDPLYFTTGPGVTNWVPARVLSVVESYELSPEEIRLIERAGIVRPGEPLERIPEGYEKQADEPWFTTWTRQGENFGFKGVNGFISHFNEERALWETSETYFSSYWPTKEEALAALDALKKTIGGECAPKRFHDFTDCWVAEYLRLRVMGVVGRKADGTWSCMLDIQDKNRLGCGQWEPPEAQAERRAEYEYRKELAAWKEAKDRVVKGNHEVVEKLRLERGIALFGESAKCFDAEDGRKVYVRTGAFDMTNTVREVVWAEKLEGLEKATGSTFDGEIEKRDIEDRYTVWGASWQTDLYDLRLDMAFPAEGANGEWRELCFERIQDGFEIPPRPRLQR